jgi:hypothetical protein
MAGIKLIKYFTEKVLSGNPAPVVGSTRTLNIITDFHLGTRLLQLVQTLAMVNYEGVSLLRGGLCNPGLCVSR